MQNYSSYQNSPSSPTIIRFPNVFMNNAKTSKSFTSSPQPHFTSLLSPRDQNSTKFEKLMQEHQKKSELCKEKEIEAQFWKKKYHEIVEESESERSLRSNSKVIEEYKQKINDLLQKNFELNKICEERLEMIKSLKETKNLNSLKENNEELPQANPQILQEIHELREQNISLNKENMELKAATLNEDDENIKRIEFLTEENQRFKALSEQNSENCKLLQEKLKILLVDNEKLNSIITKKASDIEFWRAKLQNFEENQGKHIENIKQQLEINYEKASIIAKQQINYEAESLKVTIQDLESKNSVLSKENAEAKEFISSLNAKYTEILSKIDDYELNYIEKAAYEKEKHEISSQLKRMENNVRQLLAENSKLLALYNEKNADFEIWKTKYENLENNHAEHVKQLKKTWEISQNNQIQLSVKENSLQYKQEIENLELERENLLKYIRAMEEKNKEIVERSTSIFQKNEQQKKRLVQLEAEKERVEIYKEKIKEIEEQHILEIERVKADLFYERESEQIINLQEKVEFLSEELTKMNHALDEKSNEIVELSEKLRTYEEFYEMKVREFQTKLEAKKQYFQNEKDSYIMDLERKLQLFQDEKIKYVQEIEKWRGNSLELEKKLNSIGVMQNKLEIMSNQNIALNNSLKGQMEENLFWKGQILEQEKLTQYLFEMENKIKYLMAENERLNKVIITRCRDMLNN